MASTALFPGNAIAGAPVFHGQARQYVVYTTPLKPPPAAFFGADGRFCSLAKWEGKVVLFGFWATWCVPCIWEMPHLDALQAQLGGDSFQVVTVAMDEEGLLALPKTRAFYERTGIQHLPLLFDHGREVFEGYRAINRLAMPMAYVVGRDGLLRGYMTGPAEWNSAAAHALIRYYIDQS